MNNKIIKTFLVFIIFEIWNSSIVFSMQNITPFNKNLQELPVSVDLSDYPDEMSSLISGKKVVQKHVNTQFIIKSFLTALTLLTTMGLTYYTFKTIFYNEDNFANNNPELSLGESLQNMNLSFSALSLGGELINVTDQKSHTISTIGNWDKISKIKFPLTISQSGVYSIKIRVSAGGDPSKLQVNFKSTKGNRIMTPEKNITIDIPYTGSWNLFYAVYSPKFSLSPGTYEIEVNSPDVMHSSLLLNSLEFVYLNSEDISLQMSEKQEKESSISLDKNWNLVWFDEFNGDKLDESKWQVVSQSQANNFELQVYGGAHHNGESKDNVRVEGGKLILEAQYGPPISSGKVTTQGKAAFKYGRIEAKIKLANGVGFWPAFWMMGESYGDDASNWPKCGEIDILESDGNFCQGALQRGTSFATNWQEFKRFIPAFDLRQSSHIYAIEWSPTEIKWFIDDNNFFTKSNLAKPDGGDDNYYPFGEANKDKFFLLLNMAVGGWIFDDPICLPPDHFPVQMEVDYVRVYSKEL